MATKQHTTLPRLSSLIRDPMVRAAFERAERDNPPQMVVQAPRTPVLTGGEAAKVSLDLVLA